MSHFTVLVITDQEPKTDVLEKALLPFHEFECTGHEAFIEEIDETEEAREEFEAATVTRLRAPDGSLHEPYDDEFYRDPTPEESEKVGTSGIGVSGGLSYASKDWGDGRGYRAKVKFVPDGYEEIELPRKSVEDFAAFVEHYNGKAPVPFGQTPDLTGKHKYGYALLDAEGSIVKVVNRTNPNAQWDWYVLGGRWQGLLLPKKANGGTHTGRPGLMDWTSGVGGVDACRKGDLDIEAMKNNAVNQRRDIWQDTITKAREVGITLPENELDEKRRAYFKRRGEEIEAWKSTTPRPDRREHFESFMGDLLIFRNAFDDCFGPQLCEEDTPIQEWIDTAPPLTTFAVLKDGQWFQKGEMGWWGVVHEKKEESRWESEFQNLLNDTPDDHWFAVVDCHI